jgi:hypothetical protein
MTDRRPDYFLQVKERIAIAKTRLQAIGRADEAIELSKPATPRVLANQQEILRRLSAGESMLNRIAEAVQALSDRIDTLAEADTKAETVDDQGAGPFGDPYPPSLEGDDDIPFDLAPMAA